MLKVVSDSISNTLGMSIPVYVDELNGKRFIVVDVPKGDTLVECDGRYYKRVGNTTQLMQREELKAAIMRERGVHWMDMPCDATIQDLSEDAVKSFISKGKACGRVPAFIDDGDIMSVLKRYKLIDGDNLTYAGALLFAQDPSRFKGGAFLKIGEFNQIGLILRETMIERPLIEIPDEAIRVLYESYIPPTFVYVQASRELSYRYPVEAVRELLVNALIHKDYQVTEPVTIRIFKDSMWIFCFGGLPDGWGVDMLLKPHESIWRNETLADVFHDAKFVENWGQGISKVLDECKRNGNTGPVFQQDVGGLRVVLASKVSTRVETISDSNGGLTERQKSILELIRENPRISTADLSIELNLSLSTVKRDLLILSQKGVIKRAGARRTVYRFFDLKASCVAP